VQILFRRSIFVAGDWVAQQTKSSSKDLTEQICSFCSHIAGSCQITATYIFGNYAFGLRDTKVIEVLLVLRGFQPRLISYVKTFGNMNVVIFAVDKWVFERDVDRGFLGEALSWGFLLPYLPIINEDYLHQQEIKLKKRLIRELLENLVLNFPELCLDFHIEPEYFMYEALLSRTRLFPPVVYDVRNFARMKEKSEGFQQVLQGYLESLKELEKENAIKFSNGYVRISEEFVNKFKNRKVRFINLFKPAQKALFISLLGAFPKILNIISQNAEVFFKLKWNNRANAQMMHLIPDSKRFLHVPTARGLVPWSNRVSIEDFARNFLACNRDVKIEIEEIGGVLNEAYLVKSLVDSGEKKFVVKRFRDWSSFKWFPLSLWTVGTKTFAVMGRSRLERECAINHLLFSKGFAVPKLFHVNQSEHLIFMEYVEGETLEKIIRKIVNSKDASEVKKELGIICEVGEILAKVHALNISLGDTKPENIIIRKNGEICLLDFEQASRNGDKVWDIAEFLYYAGHYISPLSPLAGSKHAQLIVENFIKGYLSKGGNVNVIKKASHPKYTKVFSVFTLPSVMLTMASICRKADKIEKGVNE